MIWPFRECAAIATVFLLLQPFGSLAFAKESAPGMEKFDYLWAERQGSLWTVTGNDQTGWNVTFECSDVPCKVPPKNWPKQLQTHPPIFILTPKGLESATLDSFERNVVGLLEIKAALKTPAAAASKSPASLSASPDSPTKGLARVGKPFSSGARLRTISQVPPTPASLASGLERLHTSVEQKMLKKSKTFAKLQIKAEDYSLASFKSQRGKLWLAWFSFEKYQKRRESGFPESLGEVSFAFAGIVNDTGTVLETIMPPTLGKYDSVEIWEPIFFADLSGIGSEEIVADKSYYEGSRYFVYSLKKNGGVAETLLLMSGS